jgi:predicted CopG family antitoxin
MDATTIKVSKDTARELAALQKGMHAKSLEETIEKLVMRHRRELLDEAFGADSGKMTSFTEDDRDEDRS